MICKTKKIEKQLQEMELSENKDIQDTLWMVKLIDSISVRTGHGEITLTSILRKNNPASLHYYWRGIDFRLKDKSVVFYLAIVSLGKVFEYLNPKFRMNVHAELFRKQQQHVHIEKRN